MTVCGGYLLPGHLGSPQGSPGPALEGTRRVPEGQPGMSCHPTHLCDIWNKVGLWCGFVGVGGWGGALGPRRTCPLVSHTSQEAGDTQGKVRDGTAVPSSSQLLHLSIWPNSSDLCPLDTGALAPVSSVPSELT